ncbi:MAG TPA: undecaprenyl-diphosphate phosphatase [Candidatus Methanoperedens sp.]|nr:undecaprenyl-diphosphate phosphatase [Candidatus Methanoperedens sp.]
MSFIQSLILSIIQGITEFLPVSSSGHLNLFQHFFGLTPSLGFDIFLNTATLLSVLFFFRLRIKFFFSHLPQIIVASIPAAFVGIFLNDNVESIFSNYSLLPLFFIINSSILLTTKRSRGEKSEITLLQAIIIGISQAFAILPGVSRAGTTIATALALGLSPETAFNFSFCLFIPASLGAIVLGVTNLDLTSYLNIQYLASFLLTFIVGLFSLNILQKVLKNRQIWFFGIYTLFLALLLLFLT